MVSLIGEADVQCRDLEPAFAVLAEGGPSLLIVDHSGLWYMDCWSLSVVLGTGLDLSATGSRVALAGPQAVVARLLQLIGTDRVFPVYCSEKAVAR